MKIRNLLLAATVLAFGFYSCDLEELTPTTEVSVDMTVDMPLEGSSQKSANEDDIPFSGSGTLNLSSEESISQYIDNLKDFTLDNGTQITLSHIPDTLEVYSITVSITIGKGAKEKVVSFKSEEGFKNGETLPFDEASVKTINNAVKILKPEFKQDITWSIEGTSNQDMNKYSEADVRPKAELLLKTLIEAGI